MKRLKSSVKKIKHSVNVDSHISYNTIGRMRDRLRRLSRDALANNVVPLNKKLLLRDVKPSQPIDRLGGALRQPSAFRDFKPDIVSVAKICKERKMRREVLFAKGKQGGNHKPPVFTWKSYVRCG